MLLEWTWKYILVQHRPSRSCGRLSGVLKLHFPSINFQRGLSAFAEIQFLRKGWQILKGTRSKKGTLIKEPKSLFGFRQCYKLLSAHIFYFSKLFHITVLKIKNLELQRLLLIRQCHKFDWICVLDLYCKNVKLKRGVTFCLWVLLFDSRKHYLSKFWNVFVPLDCKMFMSKLQKWVDALRGSSPARCNNGT